VRRVALLFVLLATPALAAPTRVQSGPPAAGDAAPEVVASRVSGSDPVSITQLRGRVVVLDFWATWCGPCRAVSPMLDVMHRRHHAQGLTVLGISSEQRATVAAHLQRHPVAYTVASDGRQSLRRYGVRGMPTLVVIDRAGKVRNVMQGVNGQSMSTLQREVEAALREAP